MTAATILAAGGLMWRPDGDRVRIALVHRPRYDDWSLPKGTLKESEHPLEAACREVIEETGCRPLVQRELPGQSYLTPRGGKHVRYWVMRVDDRYRPIAVLDEVDAMAWLTPVAAADRLSYDRDRAVLRAFARIGPRTTTVLFVRHGKADTRHLGLEDWQRPLDERGHAQAERLAEVLPWFGPRRVFSADRTRCVQTVEPLARRLGRTVEEEPLFSSEGYAAGPSAAVRRLREIASSGGPSVVCSQGDVIPDVLATLAGRDDVPMSEFPARKGSVWALSFRDGVLLAADYYRGLDAQ